MGRAASEALSDGRILALSELTLLKNGVPSFHLRNRAADVLEQLVLSTCLVLVAQLRVVFEEVGFARDVERVQVEAVTVSWAEKLAEAFSDSVGLGSRALSVPQFIESLLVEDLVLSVALLEVRSDQV